MQRRDVRWRTCSDAIAARREQTVATMPLPFDVTAEDVALGARRVRLWRPSRPEDVHDPEAERGAAGPVWAQTWTSGVVLAALVSRWPLRGARVLELGCGLGLVGVAAAAAGARVTVSDRSRHALAFAAVNAEVNGVAVDPVRCEWTDPAPLAAAGPWDLVLAADVLYDERSARLLLELLPHVVAPGGAAWLADPGRRPAAAFFAAAWTDWHITRRPMGYGVCVHRLAPVERRRRRDGPRPRRAAA